MATRPNPRLTPRKPIKYAGLPNSTPKRITTRFAMTIDLFQKALKTTPIFLDNRIRLTRTPQNTVLAHRRIIGGRKEHYRKTGEWAIEHGELKKIK